MSARPAIVLVDDERANLLLLRTYLKDIDCSVSAYQDPVRALEVAEQAPPDLMVIDLQMPEMDGIELCRRLKAASSTRLVPVLVVTALDSRERRLAALEGGADDFLSKPIDRVELLARVRSLLRLKGVMDQLQDANLAKNEFLANMSHEMRQPLNSILGFTELLLTNPQALADQPRAHRYIDNVQTAGRHLLALITDVLDLAKIESRRLELTLIEVEVKELLTSLHEMMLPIARSKGVRLRVRAQPRLAVVADDMRLRQIVLNLVTNAVKFTPSGGLVSIGASSGAGWMEITVADTGVGIAAEDQGRVFEAFTQLDVATNREPGAGLGLAMVKQLTELHGGRVSLESELGRGTTVKVRLPRAEPSAPKAHGKRVVTRAIPLDTLLEDGGQQALEGQAGGA
ncbi:MAG: hybrid sensor histidine kinase/response regulator [Chloroflexi bacterium]|nr:MAG: hybrid sensor histidine kinase/response regulator [Chloroflexota bacterium]